MILGLMCTAAVLILASVHACCRQDTRVLSYVTIGLAIGAGSLIDCFIELIDEPFKKRTCYFLIDALIIYDLSFDAPFRKISNSAQSGIFALIL